ncbi:hypothetical protein PsorP6_012574 [Peronosclerospora sorghi]|uniref:Uncharacterized protein n=1 Tax=Peronosclerospora sorghi TaxID=230839 RepID=A0ACC0WEW4_9STRA|nr:hypothetical protein PsorP6_012574 [Peronosclerospora sorghi]
MERFCHELSEKTVEQLVEYKCVTRKVLSVETTVAGNVAAALDVDVETIPLLGDLCGQVKYSPLACYEEMSQSYKPHFKMKQSHKVLIERFTLKESVPTALCDGRRAHY